MTPLIYVIAFASMGLVGTEVVDLKCSDNATCINSLPRELYNNIKHHKTVRLFDVLTIEPLKNRQARSNQGPLTRLLTSHAISFNWNDLTFRFSNPEDKYDSMDLEVFENRSSKADEPEPIPKKSSSKIEDGLEDKLPKMRIKRKRKVHKRKLLQAVIPLMFGMKSTGAVMFAMAIVTAITLKAFFASKLALMVTVGMAMKRLYDSYSNGVGLPNNPYMYSQYPIDFPSASSQAYSVHGVNPQFATPEMYNPTALGTQSHSQEILHQNEVTAQQSQQAPTLVLNSTRSASERWDGKSKLLKFLEPILGSMRSVFEPIAKVFYSMPATVRGLSSDVTTATIETGVNEDIKTDFLVPQPRYIAQRKMNYRMPTRTKKYTELKINLERLRQNKDLYDYIKTKKYKFNYPLTFYYPRVKYVINPNTFATKPNNSRLTQYRKETIKINETKVENNEILNLPNDWKPIIPPANNTLHFKTGEKKSKKRLKRKNVRSKRSAHMKDLNLNTNSKNLHDLALDNDQRSKSSSRGFLSYVEFLFDPISFIFKHAAEYTNSLLDDSLNKKTPPKYYTLAHRMIMYNLDALAGMLDLGDEIKKHYISGLKKKKKYKKKSKSKDKVKKPKIKITSKF